MKKLFLVILIITLPLIGFFQYKNYRRFHPPVDYDYLIADEIDVNYHDQELVDEYYRKAIEIGSFARLNWSNNAIDVRFPDEGNQEAINASKYYNQLISRTKYLEDVLVASAKLKKEYLTNEQVKLIEAGFSKDEIEWMETKDQLTSISFGEQSEFVWRVQKQLIEKGYEHALDGLFGIDTQNAIISFQQDNNIYSSGLINEQTFELLFLR